MRKGLIPIAVVLSSILIVSIPMMAHHGNAVFNTEKTVTVNGAVTEWVWANPHCFLKFDEKTNEGEVRHWVVEANNPPGMINLGWSKYSFKPGDEVTVTASQARNGKPVGRIIEATTANGTLLGRGPAGQDQP